MSSRSKAVVSATLGKLAPTPLGPHSHTGAERLPISRCAVAESSQQPCPPTVALAPARAFSSSPSSSGASGPHRGRFPTAPTGKVPSGLPRGVVPVADQVPLADRDPMAFLDAPMRLLSRAADAVAGFRQRRAKLKQYPRGADAFATRGRAAPPSSPLPEFLRYHQQQQQPQSSPAAAAAADTVLAVATAAAERAGLPTTATTPSGLPAALADPRVRAAAAAAVAEESFRADGSAALFEALLSMTVAEARDPDPAVTKRATKTAAELRLQLEATARAAGALLLPLRVYTHVAALLRAAATPELTRELAGVLVGITRSRRVNPRIVARAIADDVLPVLNAKLLRGFVADAFPEDADPFCSDTAASGLYLVGFLAAEGGPALWRRITTVPAHVLAQQRALEDAAARAAAAARSEEEAAAATAAAAAAQSDGFSIEGVATSFFHVTAEARKAAAVAADKLSARMRGGGRGAAGEPAETAAADAADTAGAATADGKPAPVTDLPRDERAEAQQHMQQQQEQAAAAAASVQAAVSAPARRGRSRGPISRTLALVWTAARSPHLASTMDASPRLALATTLAELQRTMPLAVEPEVERALAVATADLMLSVQGQIQARLRSLRNMPEVPPVVLAAATRALVMAADRAQSANYLISAPAMRGVVTRYGAALNDKLSALERLPARQQIGTVALLRSHYTYTAAELAVALERMLVRQPGAHAVTERVMPAFAALLEATLEGLRGTEARDALRAMLRRHKLKQREALATARVWVRRAQPAGAMEPRERARAAAKTRRREAAVRARAAEEARLAEAVESAREAADNAALKRLRAELMPAARAEVEAEERAEAEAQAEEDAEAAHKRGKGANITAADIESINANKTDDANDAEATGVLGAFKASFTAAQRETALAARADALVQRRALVSLLMLRLGEDVTPAATTARRARELGLLTHAEEELLTALHAEGNGSGTTAAAADSTDATSATNADTDAADSAAPAATANAATTAASAAAPSLLERARALGETYMRTRAAAATAAVPHPVLAAAAAADAAAEAHSGNTSTDAAAAAAAAAAASTAAATPASDPAVAAVAAAAAAMESATGGLAAQEGRDMQLAVLQLMLSDAASDSVAHVRRTQQSDPALPRALPPGYAEVAAADAEGANLPAMSVSAAMYAGGGAVVRSTPLDPRTYLKLRLLNPSARELYSIARLHQALSIAARREAEIADAEAVAAAAAAAAEAEGDEEAAEIARASAGAAAHRGWGDAATLARAALDPSAYGVHVGGASRGATGEAVEEDTDFVIRQTHMLLAQRSPEAVAAEMEALRNSVARHAASSLAYMLFHPAEAIQARAPQLAKFLRLRSSTALEAERLADEAEAAELAAAEAAQRALPRITVSTPLGHDLRALLPLWEHLVAPRRGAALPSRAVTFLLRQATAVVRGAVRAGVAVAQATGRARKRLRSARARREELAAGAGRVKPVFAMTEHGFEAVDRHRDDGIPVIEAKRALPLLGTGAGAAGVDVAQSGGPGAVAGLIGEHGGDGPDNSQARVYPEAEVATAETNVPAATVVTSTKQTVVAEGNSTAVITEAVVVELPAAPAVTTAATTAETAAETVAATAADTFDADFEARLTACLDPPLVGLSRALVPGATGAAAEPPTVPTAHRASWAVLLGSPAARAEAAALAPAGTAETRHVPHGSAAAGLESALSALSMPSASAESRAAARALVGMLRDALSAPTTATTAAADGASAGAGGSVVSSAAWAAEVQRAQRTEAGALAAVEKARRAAEEAAEAEYAADGDDASAGVDGTPLTTTARLQQEQNDGAVESPAAVRRRQEAAAQAAFAARRQRLMLSIVHARTNSAARGGAAAGTAPLTVVREGVAMLLASERARGGAGASAAALSERDRREATALASELIKAARGRGTNDLQSASPSASISVESEEEEEVLALTLDYVAAFVRAQTAANGLLQYSERVPLSVAEAQIADAAGDAARDPRRAVPGSLMGGDSAAVAAAIAAADAKAAAAAAAAKPATAAQAQSTASADSKIVDAVVADASAAESAASKSSTVTAEAAGVVIEVDETAAQAAQRYAAMVYDFLHETPAAVRFYTGDDALASAFLPRSALTPAVLAQVDAAAATHEEG